MSAYPAGTVAVITHGGDSYRAVKDDKGWASLDPEIGWVTERDVTDIRPLVVLDLASAFAEPCSLVEYLRAGNWHNTANQIEAQTKPPRIPEPGLWGVVEAHINGESSRPQAIYRWLHLPQGWQAVGSMQPVRTWDDLVDPTLIREGLS